MIFSPAFNPSQAAAVTEWKSLTRLVASKPGERFALASLIHREGSSYRQPGARLVIASDGSYAGCLSGGCLEESIAQVGLRVLHTGVGEPLRIDTRPHFGCPGVLDIWVEPLPRDFFDDISAALAERRQVWLRTTPSCADASADSGGTQILGESPIELNERALVQALGLLPRLIVASATHDADPLCELASWMGWEVKRVVHFSEAVGNLSSTAAASAEIVPPPQLAERFPCDARTACVVMTHHLGRDAAYLRHALLAGYPYVGLLGSRRRREALLNELGETGILEDLTVTERLRAPVGLDLGADDPRGIALAIVAEIQASWAGTCGGSLRDRRGPLHLRPVAA